MVFNFSRQDRTRLIFFSVFFVLNAAGIYVCAKAHTLPAAGIWGWRKTPPLRVCVLTHSNSFIDVCAKAHALPAAGIGRAGLPVPKWAEREASGREGMEAR